MAATDTDTAAVESAAKVPSAAPTNAAGRERYVANANPTGVGGCCWQLLLSCHRHANRPSPVAGRFRAAGALTYNVEPEPNITSIPLAAVYD